MLKKKSIVYSMFAVMFTLALVACASIPGGRQVAEVPGRGAAFVPPPGNQPVLAVLPFTGGVGGDGETIATLFSFNEDINRSFRVAPRTAALDAIFNEHAFQLDGMTDADTIAGIGRMLNAQYVLSGNIRRLGDRNLIIATIINVETYEQVSGYFRTYRTIEEIHGFLPSMAQNMLATAFRDTSGFPNLAIMPLEVAGISAHDAETLAKILAIEITHSGRYSVLPRTSAIEAAQREIAFQLSGYTEEERRARLGQVFNANLLLAIGARRLGGINMFTAHILDVRDGTQISGYYRTYQVIADGLYLMAELAILLSEPPGLERDRQLAVFRQEERIRQEAARQIREEEQRIQEEERQRLEEERARQERITRRRERIDARRMSGSRRVTEITAGYYWEVESTREADGNIHKEEAVIFTLGIFTSPLPYTSIGVQLRYGFFLPFPESEDPDPLFLLTAAPAVGFVIPLGHRARVFGNFLVEMGTFGYWDGLLTDWATPSVNVGLELGNRRPENFTFTVQYRVIWFQDVYVHGISGGIGWRW